MGTDYGVKSALDSCVLFTFLLLRVLRSFRQLLCVLILQLQGRDGRDLVADDSLHVAVEADGVFNDPFDCFFALFPVALLGAGTESLPLLNPPIRTRSSSVFLRRLHVLFWSCDEY